MRYEGSNPSLCTTFFAKPFAPEFDVDMRPAGNERLVVALAGLGLLAVLVWRTMEPGKYQQLAWLLLGFFAVRVVMGRFRSRS